MNYAVYFVSVLYNLHEEFLVKEKDSGLAVVAGASGGLGQPVVEALIASGYRVRAVGRERERLEPLKGEGSELI